MIITVRKWQYICESDVKYSIELCLFCIFISPLQPAKHPLPQRKTQINNLPLKKRVTWVNVLVVLTSFGDQWRQRLLTERDAMLTDTLHNGEICTWWNKSLKMYDWLGLCYGHKRIPEEWALTFCTLFLPEVESIDRAAQTHTKWRTRWRIAVSQQRGNLLKHLSMVFTEGVDISRYVGVNVQSWPVNVEVFWVSIWNINALCVH